AAIELPTGDAIEGHGAALGEPLELVIVHLEDVRAAQLFQAAAADRSNAGVGIALTLEADEHARRARFADALAQLLAEPPASLRVSHTRQNQQDCGEQQPDSTP